jgi:hypothetical protein
MDSILIFEIDRIYRITWIFCIAGFRMKPAISNPLRGKNDLLLLRIFLPLLAIHQGIPIFENTVMHSPPAGGYSFHGIIAARLT